MHGLDKYVWLLLTAVATLVYSSKFVRGFLSGEAIMDITLSTERKTNPIFFWSMQSYYALVVTTCAYGFWLFATRWPEDGAAWPKPGPAMFPFVFICGVMFLAGGMIVAYLSVVSLRSGVAFGKRSQPRKLPPARHTKPVRYWMLQVAYVFSTCLMLFLGLVTIAVVIWK